MRNFQSLLGCCITLIFIFLGVACSNERVGDHYTGYVEAEYIYIAAPQNGWIENLAVREGDEVNAGDIIVRLERGQQTAQLDVATGTLQQAQAQLLNLTTGARPEEIEALEANLDEANARLVQANAEKKRWLPLVREGNASKARGDQVTAEYNAALARVKAAEESIVIAKLGGRDAAREAATAGVEVARAGVSEAKWALGQRSIAAFKSGSVEDIFHRTGEFVAVGRPILSVLPQDSLKVRFFVPQSDVSNFSTGDKIRLKKDGSDETLAATVSFIAKETEFTPPVIFSLASRQKLVFMIEARLENGVVLHPGLPVDVIVP